MSEEVKTISIIAAIVTVLIFLVMIVFAIAGIVTAQYGLSIVCLCIAVIQGYFVWTDYYKYVRKE